MYARVFAMWWTIQSGRRGCYIYSERLEDRTNENMHFSLDLLLL